jgi:MFS family permease
MNALLLASALGGVALTWLLSSALGRLSAWRRAACWLVAAVVVLVAGAVIGSWLGGSLPNDDCDDICDTPAWRGLLAGWVAAAAQLPVVVLAAVALLTRRYRPPDADKRFGGSAR